MIKILPQRIFCALIIESIVVPGMDRRWLNFSTIGDSSRTTLPSSAKTFRFLPFLTISRFVVPHVAFDVVMQP